MRQTEFVFPDTGCPRQEFLSCSDRHLPHFSIQRRGFTEGTLSLDLLTPWYKGKLAELPDLQRRFLIALVTTNALLGRNTGSPIQIKDIRDAQKIHKRHHSIPLSPEELNNISAVTAALENKGVLTKSNQDETGRACYRFTTPAFETWCKGRHLDGNIAGWDTLRSPDFFADLQTV